VLEKACARWPGVRVVTSDGPGAGAARNAAIAAARGRYLALLDSDDVWLPEHVERLVALLRARPDVGVATAASLVFDADGPIGIHASGRAAWIGNALERVVLDDVMCVSAVVVRAETMRDVGGFSERRQLEDLETFIRLALATRFVFDPRIACLIRRHAASRSRSHRSGRHAALLQVLRAIPRDTRVGRTFARRAAAHAWSQESRWHRLAGRRRAALRSALRSWGVWPVAIEPYRLITVALLSERAEARVRSRLLGPIPDEIADEVRRVAGPA
jgi:glycosyltransferase involved in cell wall biosynthesis